MSKKKIISSGSRKKSKKFQFNTEKRIVPLKEKLQQIYSETVNLEATCKGVCECCKTAMPQMNFSEFSQIINEVWDTTSRDGKIELICMSVEYFFRNQFEKWGLSSLVKPCLLLTNDGKCSRYDSRPLCCRLYGLWPEDVYNKRVDRFNKAYEGLLTRDELPLNKQCPNVKRKDETVALTKEVIDSLFVQLDSLDKKIGNFTDVQIEQKENYRTFHDFLLLKIFGEDWLVNLTDFIMAADKNAMIDLLEQLKKSIRNQFAKEMPDIRSKKKI
jgi:Fe-S-cluster containining protein